MRYRFRVKLDIKSGGGFTWAENRTWRFGCIGLANRANACGSNIYHHFVRGNIGEGVGVAKAIGGVEWWCSCHLWCISRTRHIGYSPQRGKP